MRLPDRLKQGESGVIRDGCIGTPQGIGDLGSAWLSEGRAEGRSDIDARTVHITTSDRREARSMRLRLVDANASEDAKSKTGATPCFSRNAGTRIPANIEQIRAAVTRSRAEQGLPPTIEDSEVLERVAAIFKLVVAPARATAQTGLSARGAA